VSAIPVSANHVNSVKLSAHEPSREGESVTLHVLMTDGSEQIGDKVRQSEAKAIVDDFRS